MSGPAARQLRSQPLQRLLRNAWEEQRRFPLKLATTLSQQFASRGLQFFKVNRTVTHVSVARPRYLDMEATPVSQGVRQIVEFINATPKCTRRKLFEALAPSAASSSPSLTAPPPLPPPRRPRPEPCARRPRPRPRPRRKPVPNKQRWPSDLHWLIHEGHVIEFANGILETAKKPVIKPPKPEPKPPAPTPAQAAGARPGHSRRPGALPFPRQQPKLPLPPQAASPASLCGPARHCYPPRA